MRPGSTRKASCWREGAEQVAAILTGIGVTTIQVDLPDDGMHLMGQLRFLDKRTVVSWPGRNSLKTLQALGEHGYSVLEMPDAGELRHGMALNFVCLGPRRIVMPTGNPASQVFLEKRGVECLTVEVGEITKADRGAAAALKVFRRPGAGSVTLGVPPATEPVGQPTPPARKSAARKKRGRAAGKDDFPGPELQACWRE